MTEQSSLGRATITSRDNCLKPLQTVLYEVQYQLRAAFQLTEGLKWYKSNRGQTEGTNFEQFLLLIGIQFLQPDGANFREYR